MTDSFSDPVDCAARLRTARLAWEADVRTRKECQRLGLSYDKAIASSPLEMIGERYRQYGILPIKQRCISPRHAGPWRGE